MYIFVLYTRILSICGWKVNLKLVRSYIALNQSLYFAFPLFQHLVSDCSRSGLCPLWWMSPWEIAVSVVHRTRKSALGFIHCSSWRMDAFGFGKVFHQGFALVTLPNSQGAKIIRVLLTFATETEASAREFDIETELIMNEWMSSQTLPKVDRTTLT